MINAWLTNTNAPQTMEIVKELYTEGIKGCFHGYYGDTYEGEDFDEFKDAFIEALYNTEDFEDIHDELPQIYSHLLFFLGIVKENAEEREMDFKDWDKPQKVYQLGLYFLAHEVLNFASQEDLGLSGVRERERERELALLVGESSEEESSGEEEETKEELEPSQ
jgi:hypothetical protein